jgi:spore germination cell wall hydrolase CwlJ-like protein
MGALATAAMRLLLSLHSLGCVADNAYFEARGEGEAGMAAVAQVTMNRVASRGFPDEACAVVHQPGQFAWAKHRRARPVDPAYFQALAVSASVMSGTRKSQVGRATYYHERRSHPYWASKFRRVATVRHHIFYEDRRS